MFKLRGNSVPIDPIPAIGLPLDFSGRPTLLTLLNLFIQQSVNQQYETGCDRRHGLVLLRAIDTFGRCCTIARSRNHPPIALLVVTLTDLR